MADLSGSDPDRTGVSHGGILGAVALGVDLVDVPRMEGILQRTPGFVQRVFTAAEAEYCESGVNSAERFAARWAAKEAVVKAVGADIVGIDFHDVEVLRSPNGAPGLEVRGAVGDAAADAGISAWLISLSHTAAVAEAVVIGLGR